MRRLCVSGYGVVSVAGVCQAMGQYGSRVCVPGYGAV